MNIQSTLEKIKKGDKTSLAQAITLVESTNHKDRKLSEELMFHIEPLSGKSLRIGITGIPGVGKSTFINNLGQHILQNNSHKKIGVLAIDPSSPVQGGSILGDKVRMQELANNDRVFIRPSPNSQMSGGIAPRTRETMLLMEAGGYDLMMIESVGVGQAEHYVSHLVDIFIVLIMPATGDDIQGLKKGLLELADLVVVHKCDKELTSSAKRTKTILEHNLSSYLHTHSKKPPIRLASSLENYNLEEIWRDIETLTSNIDKQEKRKTQLNHWLEQELFFQIKDYLSSHSHAKKLIEEQLKLIAQNKTSTSKASHNILSNILRSSNSS